MNHKTHFRYVMTLLAASLACTACGHSDQAISELQKNPRDFIGRYYEASARENIPGFADSETALAADCFVSTGKMTQASKVNLLDLRSLQTDLNAPQSEELANIPLIVRIKTYKRDAKSAALQVDIQNKKYFHQNSWVSATVFFEHLHEIPSPVGGPAKDVIKYDRLADFRHCINGSPISKSSKVFRRGF